jgi:hypothetical protein
VNGEEATDDDADQDLEVVVEPVIAAPVEKGDAEGQ